MNEICMGRPEGALLKFYCREKKMESVVFGTYGADIYENV